MTGMCLYVNLCNIQPIMSQTTVSIILVLAWLVPVCEVAASTIAINNIKLCNLTLKTIFCNNSIYKLFCVSSIALSIFDVFALLNMALLPLIFILFTYARILIISYRSGKNVRKKAAQTCLPPPDSF